jgi:predicted ABC-type ATPase
MTAGGVMLERLRFLAATGRDFALETTLAGRGRGQWRTELRSAVSNDRRLGKRRSAW